MTRTRALVAVIAILFVAAVVNTYVAWHAADGVASDQTVVAELHRTIRAQHLALVEGCNRLQIARVESNISQFADYKVFRVVLLESSLPRRHESAKRRRLTRAFLKPLAASVRDKAWTPRTDCRRAVNARGVRYEAPRPIPFVKRLPPKSDLRLTPGDFR